MSNAKLFKGLLAVAIILLVISMIVPEAQYDNSGGQSGLGASYNLNLYYWGANYHDIIKVFGFQKTSANTTFWWNENTKNNIVDYFLISLAGVIIGIIGALGGILSGDEKRKEGMRRTTAIVSGIGSLLAVIFFAIGLNDFNSKASFTSNLYFGFFLTIGSLILSFVAAAIS